MGNGNPYGHEASIYFILLIVGILSFSYNEPANSRVWHGVQFGLIFAITLGWGYVTMILNQPTNAQKQQEQENLQKAIPLAGDSGVTQQWYNQMGDILSKISVAAVTWIISAVVHSMIYSYPDSVFEHFGTMIQAKWENDILQNYSHKTIFIAGVWLSDFIVFWAFGLAYAFLDLTRPKLLLPFKVQEDYSLTMEDFLMALKRAMVNQMLVLVIIYFLWDIYPLLAPSGFDTQLPSLLEAVVSLLIFIPFSDVWFFSWHYLMHYYDWTWSHIHYIHHEFTAPIAIGAVYAHPVEHIWVNVITVMLGPFVMGSHVSLWCLWTGLSIQNTVQAHSGWHLPFLGSPDGHDFHHSSGWDNFGVTGILDAFFGTNMNWLNSWKHLIAKRYGNQDYPVDKILAANGQPFDELKQKKKSCKSNNKATQTEESETISTSTSTTTNGEQQDMEESESESGDDMELE